MAEAPEPLRLQPLDPPVKRHEVLLDAGVGQLPQGLRLERLDRRVKLEHPASGPIRAPVRLDGTGGRLLGDAGLDSGEHAFDLTAEHRAESVMRITARRRSGLVLELTGRVPPLD